MTPVKRLCTAFKNFHVTNVCIMTSGCIFKNGAPTQVLRKVRIIIKFSLCYTMREKVKIRKIQVSFILCIFWQSYATFSMRRFLLTSVYIAKLEYAGVYLFFLFLLQIIDSGYSLEPPRRGGSNVYPQSIFWAIFWAKIVFLVKFSFLQLKNICTLHRQAFVMLMTIPMPCLCRGSIRVMIWCRFLCCVHFLYARTL